MAKKSAEDKQEKSPQEAKGELTGKVRGPDVDSSHHVYEFTDPQTGEPLETPQVIHDVATGVNSDGSLKTEKANETWAKPAEEAPEPTPSSSSL